MSDERREKAGEASVRDLGAWIVGRRSWVEEACQGAVTRFRTVLVDEIRTLSRRVERLHDMLDQLEQMVDEVNDDE